MKRTTLFLSVALVVAICFAVIGGKTEAPADPKSERREVRENRRTERQAAMEAQTDSIILARSYIFRPQSAQREPAGSLHLLSNPQFEVRVWDGSADIFLPYFEGITPPYRKVLLNNTILFLDNYVAIQTDNGWDISFSTSLYSASTFTFKFEVNAKFGTTKLTISNTWNNTVTYMGMLSKIY